jgi:glucosamine--fructose-6-phosphate aminotransferase (isomerizing)
MESRGRFTQLEINSQPLTWTKILSSIQDQISTLENFYKHGKYDQLIFTGCGSPYYAALSSASLFRQLSGKMAIALPASEIFHYPENSILPNQRSLMVVLSRSGETTELIRACESFKANHRGDILTLCCYPGTPLTQQGTLNLTIPEAQEQSLAQTRAFSSLFLTASFLVNIWSGREDLFDSFQGLPLVANSILKDYDGLAAQVGSSNRFSRFYFLGSGPRYGLACELSLKMKETSLAHSEPFHVLEFRHGPKAMVNEETLVLALSGSGEDSLEMSVIDDIRQMGAKVIVSGEKSVDVNFNSNLPEAVQHVLHVLFGQLLAYHHSMSRGLNPDLPENLDSVVML